jgi:hypothetical protein
MASVTGRVEVLVDGITLLQKTGAVASGIGVTGRHAFKRKAIMSENGIAGFVEEPIEAACELTLVDRDDLLLDTLAQINQTGTVIFRAARGGKVYAMYEATCESDMSVTSGEGDTKVRFVGKKWTELTSAV